MLRVIKILNNIQFINSVNVCEVVFESFDGLFIL